jgi:hypothetical protein
MWRMTLLGFVLLAGAPLHAESANVSAAVEVPLRTYANFRIGAGTGSTRPQLCLEVAPVALVSLEACGTGSGFLHDEPEPEVAHFRGKARLGSVGIDDSRLSWQLLAGFAEVQQGEDEPGFDFGDAGSRGQSTAGPEAGLALSYTKPLSAGFEAIAEASASLGYFEHAPELAVPMRAWQTNLSFTVGVGF